MMKVSVVIPARNVEEHIGELLDSLLTQTRTPDEIVIADAGSKDRTAQIVGEYIKKNGSIKLLSIGDALPGRARNEAVKASASEVVAMVDGDGLVKKDWLEKIVKPLEEDEAIEAVFGIHIPLLKSYFDKCQAYVYLSNPQLISGRYVYSGSFHSAALKKSVFKKVGYFPEHLRATEDTEFKRMMKEKGVNIHYTTQAASFWGLNKNFLEMVRKISGYTEVRVKFNIKSRHVYTLCSFYLFYFFFFWIYPRSALLLLLLLFLRILKRIRFQKEGALRFVLNPFNWPVLVILLLINDLAHIYGCLLGLIGRVSLAKESR